MRKGFLGSVSALLTGAGLGLGQSPSPPATLGRPVAASPVAMLGRPVSITHEVDRPSLLAPELQSIASSIGAGANGSGGTIVRARVADDPPPPVWPDLAVSSAPAIPPAPGVTAAPLPTRPTLAPPAVIAQPAFNGIPEYIDGCQVIAVKDIPPERIWFSADYLLWWIRDSRLPPIISTSSSTALNTGAFGQPGTDVLFGGQIQNEERSGGRFTLGYWLDDAHTLGFEGSYFFLGRRTVPFSATSPGSPVLAQPFFDVTPGSPFQGQENAALIAFPGLPGSATVSLFSQLQGVEINTKTKVWEDPWFRVNLLGGFRFLSLHEGLQIRESTTLPGIFSIDSASEFDAQNRFFGTQIGSEVEYTWGNWAVGLRGKLALGVTHEAVTINGATITTAPPAGSSTIAAGPFAFPSNIGHHSRNQFAAVPEVGLNVGYQLTDHLHVNVGYTFIYWGDVARPGDQVDRILNNSQLPPPLGPGTLTGPARPAFAFHDADFWAQGINFGVEVRY